MRGRKEEGERCGAKGGEDWQAEYGEGFEEGHEGTERDKEVPDHY